MAAGSTPAATDTSTSADTPTARPTEVTADRVLMRCVLAICTSRVPAKASASRSAHRSEASWARTRRNESSESVTTACIS